MIIRSSADSTRDVLRCCLLVTCREAPGIPIKAWIVPMIGTRSTSGGMSVRMLPSAAPSRIAFRRNRRERRATSHSWSTASSGSVRYACSDRSNQARPGSGPSRRMRFLARVNNRSRAGSDSSGKVRSILATAYRTTPRRMSSRVSKWRNYAPEVTPISAASVDMVSEVRPRRPMMRRTAVTISSRRCAEDLRVRVATARL